MKKHLKFGICAFVTLVFAYLILTVTSFFNKLPQLVAHRGYTGTVYENTIPSIIDAKDHWYNAVELDVFETRDGILVLSHNNKINFKEKDKNITFYILNSDYQTLNQYVLQSDKKYGDIHFAKLDKALNILSKLNMEVILHCKVHKLSFFKTVANTVVNNNMSGKCMYNLDKVDLDWYKTIIQIDNNAKFHVPAAKCQDKFTGIDNKRIIMTLKMTPQTFKLYKKRYQLYDYTLYLWDVDGGEFDEALKMKPEYLEMTDALDARKLCISKLRKELLQQQK